MTKLDSKEINENPIQKAPVKVFISYSQDTSEHSRKVLEFSNSLRSQGIDCILDQYEESPPEGWVRWMDNQINTTNYTIIVCTKLYYEKIKALDKNEFGKGVKWESLLLYSQLYHNGSMNFNFIPVLFDNNSNKFIPEPLRDTTYYIMEKDFQKLSNRLKGNPNILKPKIGDEIQDQKLHQKETSKSIKYPVRLEIDEKFEEYNQEQKNALMNAISEFLKADYSIEIVKIERGSVLIYLNLTDSDIDKLIKAVESGLFYSHKLVKIKKVAEIFQRELDLKDNVEHKNEVFGWYEILFIFTPNLSEIQLKEELTNLKKYYINQGADIIHEANWGLKSLAYPIEKKTTGYYYLIEIKADTTIIERLKAQNIRDENIMRFLITKLDKPDIKYSEKERKTALSQHRMNYKT